MRLQKHEGSGEILEARLALISSALSTLRVAPEGVMKALRLACTFYIARRFNTLAQGPLVPGAQNRGKERKEAHFRSNFGAQRSATLTVLAHARDRRGGVDESVNPQLHLGVAVRTAHAAAV
jgi:hypothetical protein